MLEAMKDAISDSTQVTGCDPLRIAVALDGDPLATTAAGTKFGLFIEALRSHREVHLVGVGDSTLRGAPRAVAVAAAWRPNRRRWKEHYRKNPLTFQLRSRQSRRWVAGLQPQPELLFQVAAISRPQSRTNIPYALYLDFTFALTQREWPERAPMSRLELPLWLRLETQTYHGAAVIFCRSRYVANSLFSDYGVPPDRVHVVGAGVNLTPPDLAAIPGRDHPRVLFIGSDFKRKGGDIVLAAWRDVVRRIPEAELMLIGPVEGRLPPNARTNAGRWDPATIVRELQRASLFAMPSRCETWGDVFLEAMAYGLPCIGSSNDAMPEIIQDGETGYIVPPDDPAALADRICDLLLNPGRARAFGLAGRRRVEERYLWPDVIDQMLPVLASIPDNKPRNPLA
ncbi:MAG TPA: glycosyltransferase family 4 protein [Thermomicrobiales bacterium]|nr:glycosyltransferase family 4 protein [Thermomicrobiales bacterium]